MIFICVWCDYKQSTHTIFNKSIIFFFIACTHVVPSIARADTSQTKKLGDVEAPRPECSRGDAERLHQGDQDLFAPRHDGRPVAPTSACRARLAEPLRLVLGLAPAVGPARHRDGGTVLAFELHCSKEGLASFNNHEEGMNHAL